MISNKVNCAGQECPERDGCKRFEVRSHMKDGSTEWASFDIERQIKGNCLHRIEWEQQ